MTAAAISQLAVLTFDNIHLGLPLNEVTVIERIVGIRYSEVQGRALGSLSRMGRRYAVYGFSPRLQLLPELPGRRLFCACLEGKSARMGVAVACDTVIPVNLDQDAVLQAVPVCMQRTGAPLRYLLKHRQRLVLVSTAAALTDYINGLEDADGQEQ